MLRASIAADTPPEAVHSVANSPTDKNAPRFGETTSDRTRFTTPMLSEGTNRPIQPTSSPNTPGTIKYARTADKQIRAGKRDITK